MNASKIKMGLIDRIRRMNSVLRYGATAIIALSVMGVSGLMANQAVKSSAVEQFKKDSAQIKITLDNNINRYTDLLYNFHSFALSNNNVNATQFNRYTDTLSLNSQYSAIHMLDYVEYVKQQNYQQFYTDLINDYSQDENLHSNNMSDKNNNNLDIDQIIKNINKNRNEKEKGGENEHHIIKYVGPVERSSPYLGLDIYSALTIRNQLMSNRLNKKIQTSGKLLISKKNNKNNEYPFIVLRLPLFKEINNVYKYVGAVGEGLRFDHTLFGELNKNQNYIDFQIFASEEEGKALVYDSRFHRTSMDIAWPKALFNEKNNIFTQEDTFKIGNRDFFIKTFTPIWPPNVADISLVFLIMFFAFGISFSFIYFGVFKKIERKEFNDQAEKRVTHLKRQAHTDELTELLNRRAFFSELEEKMSIHKKNNEKMYLFFIDLDGFKRVNDTLGHSAGDVVLKEYASRLKMFARIMPCNYYRIGGDEFTVFIETRPNEKPISLQDVESFAKGLLSLTDAPFAVRDEEFMLTQSIGIAEYPSDGMTSEALFKNSDMAMYEAKRKGKNCYLFFSKKFSEEVEKRNLIINHLSTAIEKNEFHLEFQPKMKKDNDKYFIKGVETLLRWNNAKLGMISPAVFIPLAEEASLMPQIGNWLINEVAKTMHKWSKTDLGQLRVAINISAKQFSSDSLPDHYANVLAQYNIDPSKIIIEITESAMMREPQKTKEILNRFRDYGFGVSVDDFGTGYSSLSYLRQFPVTEIKIDKSFTDDILRDEHDLIIVEGIINMSHKLKLDVVVEGVETIEQVQWLEKQTLEGKGVKIQGYYFSKPLKEDKLSEFLSKNNLIYE